MPHQHLPSDAHLTAGDELHEVLRLEHHRIGHLELVGVVDRGQPEAVRRRVVVAAAVTLTLDEGVGAELLQTGAGRGERLTAALGAGVGVHEEAVARPQAVPALRAVGNIGVLAVHGNDLGAGLADGAPTDVVSDALPLNRLHRGGHWLLRAQPVAVIVAGRELTDVVQVAVPVVWGVVWVVSVGAWHKLLSDLTCTAWR